MPYEKIEDAPPSWIIYKKVSLTLEQVNRLAEIFDGIRTGNPNMEDNRIGPIAWATWEKEYVIDGDKWVKKESNLNDDKSLGAIANDSYPAADGAAAWDGTAAANRLRKFASSDGSGDKEKVDWAKYRTFFGWYDSGDAENFGAYKLPHHDVIDGGVKTVWNGVRAAMAALMGARGGVDLPSGDKTGVYDHLVNHYKQFDKEAPDLSSEKLALSYTQRVLQQSSIESLFEKYPATGDEKAWAAFSKYDEDSLGWNFSQLIFADEINADILGKLLYDGEWRLYEVNPAIGDVLYGSTILDLPEGGKHYKIEYKTTAVELSESGEAQPMYGASLRLQQLSGDEATKVGATEVLVIQGTMLAEGTWKGNTYPHEVLAESVEYATNLRIDVEHDDETWEDVKGFSYKPSYNESVLGVDINGIIFDERVIEWYKAHPDEKLGLSARIADESTFNAEGGKSTATLVRYKGVAITLNPACKLSWIREANVIQLSSNKSDKDGGEIMTGEGNEEKSKAEKLAAAKKLEEEEKQKKLDAEAEAKKKAELEGEPKDTKALGKDPPAPGADEKGKDDEKLSTQEKELAEMKERLSALEQASKTLSDERGQEKANDIVDNLIEDGVLSEAKRADATKLLLSLDGGGRKLLLSVMGGQGWNDGEAGLTLSDEKDKKPEELSEPERGIIT